MTDAEFILFERKGDALLAELQKRRLELEIARRKHHDEIVPESHYGALKVLAERIAMTRAKVDACHEPL